jgi:hypothetical protein
MTDLGNDLQRNFMRPNSVKLEAFTVRLAWGFVSTVLLLLVITALMVVAGYAGSRFPSDPQPQSVSPSRAK